MATAFDFAASAWPLFLVAALAGLLIRGGSGPRRHRFRARSEQENGAWARSEWSVGRRDASDAVGGD